MNISGREQERRMRMRCGTRTPPEWLDRVVGLPLAHRLRWGASQYLPFRSRKLNWTDAYYNQMQAWYTNPKDAVSEGLVVGDQVDLISLENNQIAVWRYKDADGVEHAHRRPIPACTPEYSEANSSYDQLISLITDWIREAVLMYPTLLQPRSVISAVNDRCNRLWPHCPDWGKDILRHHPATEGVHGGGYFVSGGDMAVIEYWEQLQPEISLLAAFVEKMAIEGVPSRNAHWRAESQDSAGESAGGAMTTGKPVRNTEETPDSPAAAHPSVVFISYAHEDGRNERVSQLAANLRNIGVDVRLDEYEQCPAQGWPMWMMQQIRSAQFVLVVCSDRYRRRVEGDEVAEVGKGAKWEGALVVQQIYDAEGKNKKFIPVLLDIEDHAHVPLFLRGSTYYDVSNSNSFEDLYARLTHRLRKEVPPIGNTRPLRRG